MVLDSYGTPVAQSLLRLAQERHSDRRAGRRILITETAVAALFLLVAGLVATLAHASRPLSLEALGLTVFALLVAARVIFPVGSACTAPMQLVFVPMLFMLPMPDVPLVVAGCWILDLWPQAREGRLTANRVLTRVGDSFYSLGPVLVLVLSGHQDSPGTQRRCSSSPSPPRWFWTAPRAWLGPGLPRGSRRPSRRRCCGCI